MSIFYAHISIFFGMLQPYQYFLLISEWANVAHSFIKMHLCRDITHKLVHRDVLTHDTLASTVDHASLI